jgi:hypothetical protein
MIDGWTWINCVKDPCLPEWVAEPGELTLQALSHNGAIYMGRSSGKRPCFLCIMSVNLVLSRGRARALSASPCIGQRTGHREAERGLARHHACPYGWRWTQRGHVSEVWMLVRSS